ncbi:alpha/beta hydrolase [Aphanizomenon flos-aquae NRERC-008]|jgi:pimeloyl-ACP methyl ester carboxylesterase|uniref:Alpha/beta hydrolase n=1 Tax=Aphanizomenon flos-aquae FACHB-1249 TaxID=2692889 RepID=A0ABR8IVX0_APHFL|nr:MULTISPECIES: alpha/beta hydrolase [Aphanizomenon]MBD2392118.1 alpha/beta hydrolase [Aphanizomenon flos-aquae FACHB-1171]MBD2558878.1 alpha/beta hydrolase [Aphanizomenon flos-aquae FACHB-1290]MBD2632994.1 alpha/beta hydrolase [Aphanizomenon sp. FACHB-1399]MBD2643883.1 alpha/beta hydrolase [Aphanizomenon sp. FACHB-1401]MBD2658707.1 alpha/beta hydrolase [Aphanizomenon flos-aquae FACHB-1265]
MKDWWQDNFPQGQQNLVINDSQGYPIQIAYGEKGTGKPLILLHGLGSWSYNWRYSIEPLSQHYRVICCDFKGFGFSEKPVSRREENGHQIIELKRIIQALCNEPPVIVAESMGGLISLGLAGKSPDLIGHLVVINVPIFAETLPHWSMNLLSQTPIEIIHLIDNLRLTYWFAPLVREVMGTERRKVLYNPSLLTEKDIYWITYPFIEIPGTLVKVAEELQIAAREIENLRTNQPNMLKNIQRNLKNIECPTLILWGDKDSWFPVSHGEKLHQNLPNSRLQILRNCYHDAATDSAEVINTAILEFLNTTN